MCTYKAEICVFVGNKYRSREKLLQDCCFFLLYFRSRRYLEHRVVSARCHLLFADMVSGAGEAFRRASKGREQEEICMH